MNRYPLTMASICLIFCTCCNRETKQHEKANDTINGTFIVENISDSTKTTDISENSSDSCIDSDLINLFGMEMKRDSKTVIDSLLKKRIIEADSITQDEHEELHCVVKFGGVKFGLNSSKTGLYFLTSRKSDRDYKKVKKAIEKFYGKGKEDDWHSCYWRSTLNNGVDIRIRPLHSEEGGLVMFWNYPIKFN